LSDFTLVVSNLDYKQFAERHRPRIHPPGAILFLTYRLAGSIPKATVREYKAKKEWLENELNRTRKIAQGSGMPGRKQQLERFEKFNRD